MLTKDGRLPHYAVKSQGMFNVKTEDVDTVKNKVQWVGNTYNFLDSDGEVLMDGVCSQSIKERGPDSNAVGKIKHFMNHDADPTRSPGKIIELSEKEMIIKGVTIKCLCGVTEMNMKTQLGRETLEKYANGEYDQHSIGFQYLDIAFLERKHGNSKEGEEFKRLCENLINPEEAEDKGMIIRVDSIKLYENSTVSFGANSMTPSLGIKGRSIEAIKLAFENRLVKFQTLLNKGAGDEGLREDYKYMVDIQCLQLKQIADELFCDAAVKDLMKQKIKESNDFYLDIADMFKKSNAQC